MQYRQSLRCDGGVVCLWVNQIKRPHIVYVWIKNVKQVYQLKWVWHYSAILSYTCFMEMFMSMSKYPSRNPCKWWLFIHILIYQNLPLWVATSVGTFGGTSCEKYFQDITFSDVLPICNVSSIRYLCNRIPLYYWLWHKILSSINQSQPS